MKTDFDTFAEWLDWAITSAGTNNAQLAINTGISRAYIGQLRNGTANPKTGLPPQPRKRIVDELARALGQPLAVARNAAQIPTEDKPGRDEDYLLGYYRDLPVAMQSIAQALMRTLYNVSAPQDVAEAEAAASELPDDALEEIIGENTRVAKNALSN